MGKEKICDSTIRVHVIIAVLVYISVLMCTYYIHCYLHPPPKEQQQQQRQQQQQQQHQEHLSISSDAPTKNSKSTLHECNQTIDLIIQFINGANNSKLERNLNAFLFSVLSRTSCFISLHIVVDESSKTTAENSIDTLRMSFDNFNITYINSSDVLSQLRSIRRGVYDVSLGEQELHRYYNRWFFYTSLVLHRILPALSRVIMMDIDIQLRTDIQHLFHHFYVMEPSQIIGLAREQQPVYAHVTWEYREMHKHTLVGDPPPKGLTGFNSGVLLMNLDRMRQNKVYSGYLENPGRLSKLADEFKFRGHLGDQDVFTLLSFKHIELFMTLPCQWNRQLCQWWRNKGFEKVFHLYFQCAPPYFVLHGNCDTAIPN